MRLWRPTDKEINGKLSAARSAVAQRKYFFHRPDKVYADLAALGLFTDEDIHSGLVAALIEIHSKQYAGSHPPQKAYEEGLKEKELFAFCWDSHHFGLRVYLKFVDLSNENGLGLSIVSLHVDRPFAPKRRS